MTARERFQRQFDKLTLKIPAVTPKPMTGIQKEAAERAEAKAFWDALERGQS